MIRSHLASAALSIALVAAAPHALADDDGVSAHAAQAPAAVAGRTSARPIDLLSLLDEMTDRVRLAEFPSPPYVARLFSSYDRASTDPALESWFANDDRGNVLRVEPREGRSEGVLAEVDGPGAVVRIWSANPAGTLRFYLDGAAEATLAEPMAAWLDGSGPVPPPLSASRSRGFVSYLPVPFARGCVVTCDEHEGLYYHVSVRSYPASTAVASSCARDLETHAGAIRAAGERLVDPDIEYHYRSRVARRIAPGEEAILFDMVGPAAIAEVHLHIEAQDVERALRTSLLIGEFDGNRTVHCPLGDFFGSAPGINPYASRAATVDGDGTLTSRWLMPFADSGRLLLRNVGGEPIEIEGTVGSSQHEWGERSLHFHARWRGECFPTRPRRTFELAAIEGRGVWVGDSLVVGNAHPAWWGEGDEMIRVDGESFPSHFGTGTEDYYGYAWASEELFAAPLHGLTRLDGPAHLGFTSLYRWRALDAIPFERALRFDLEAWHWAKTDACYAGTSFFYAAPGASCSVESVVDPALLAVPVLGLRLFRRAGALEGELLAAERSDDGVRCSVQTLGDGAEGSWSGMRHLFAQPSSHGQSVVLTVPNARPGRHEVIVWLTRAPDYGVVRFRVNGAEAGPALDCFVAGDPAVPVAHSLGVHDLRGDSFALGVTVTGSNERALAPGTFWGLDCLELRPRAGDE